MRKISFLELSDTEYISYTLGETQWSGVVDQHKMSFIFQGVSFVWEGVWRESWLGVCFSFIKERKTRNQMSREVGRNADKSYGKGKTMMKQYSQKQIKYKKIKLKSITNQLIWKLENICNIIEKSLIDLSFSGYNPKRTVHGRKILHFSLLIKIYLWKTQFYDWKERLDTGHIWQYRQTCRHM